MKAGRTALALLAATALVGAGCGSDDEETADTAGGGSTGAQTESSGGSGGGTASTVEMSMTDFEFDPANPSVKAGTVTFDVSNDGQSPHALEVEGPSGEKETPVLQPGKSAELEVALNEPGSYTMYCPVGNHRQLGMEGTIKVGGSSESGSSDSGSGGGGGAGY